ncbi:MAG: MFS transporter [Thalassobaculaceae bacterium]|nr:MFS transporter [Thalassobaculaceae bacterium]
MSQNAPSAPTAMPSPALLGIGWFLCALFFFYAFVQRVAPSVMVDELMRDFAVGGALVGNLSAFYYYAYAGSQIPVGVMLDRFGPRRLITVAIALVAVGSVVFAQAETLWMAYLGRMLIGFGCAFSFAGALNYAAIWMPPSRFATLGGWAQMLGVIGGITGQAPLGAAVEAFGWRPMMLVVGLFGAVLALACGLILRDRRRADDAPARPRLLAGLKRAAGSGQVWLAAMFGLAMTSAMLAFGGLWGVPYVMQAYGFHKAEAALVVSMLFIGWGIGAPLFGWLADRYRRRKLFMIIGAVLSTVGIAAAVYLPHTGAITLGATLVVQGLGACSMVLCFAVGRENTPIWAAGATIGIINGCVVGSGAVLQPLLGWVLDLAWDGTLVEGARVYTAAAYERAFLVLPVIGVFGLIIALVIRETHAKGVEE